MRFILARHAETVFNANGRMQGNAAHTPLTRRGIAQAEAMGIALAELLGRDPELDIWASPAGRTLQTVAIIAEYLGRDFFDIRTDPRLFEMDVGDWQGRKYAEVVAETGEIMCPTRRIFFVRPPGGEWYPAVADRLRRWLEELHADRTILVISHGLTLRVLRGLLAGGEPFEGVALAEDASQGSVFRIRDGSQELLFVGNASPPNAAH